MTLLHIVCIYRWAKCVPKTCGEYPVDNGYIRGMPSTSGNTITVLCNAGYDTVLFYLHSFIFICFVSTSDVCKRESGCGASAQRSCDF